MLAAALLSLAVGSALFCVRSKTTGSPAGPEAGGHNGNPSARAVPKGDGSGNKVLPKGSGPVYMTQEQQDSRQHLWGKPNLPEVEKARRNGAKAKVTLRVIDSRGAPVPDANIQVAFFPQDAYEAAIITKGLTDKEGLFSVSGKTVDDLSFTASKTNHYFTSRAFHFYWRGTECVKDGRWQPWNPTLEVVMKERRRPVPMYTRSVEAKMPAHDVPVGYDFAKGDWVEPYGKGQSADMTLTYSETPRTNSWRRYGFTVAFTNQQDGAYRRKKDKYSQFWSAYEADTNGYNSVFKCVYERTDDRILQEERIGEDDLLVFRVRTRADGHGNVSEAHYGKIHGPFKFADGPQRLIKFSYYFNPTQNDRNLEFDGKTNLFNPDWRDGWPRNP